MRKVSPATDSGSMFSIIKRAKPLKPQRWTQAFQWRSSASCAMGILAAAAGSATLSDAAGSATVSDAAGSATALDSAAAAVAGFRAAAAGFG